LFCLIPTHCSADTSVNTSVDEVNKKRETTQKPNPIPKVVSERKKRKRRKKKKRKEEKKNEN
jgi:hypothetical protein